MKVTLMPGLAEISGSTKNKFGKRIEFRTHINSQGKRETRMYFRDASSYKRTGKPSQVEEANRSLFYVRNKYVQELMQSGECASKAEAWAKAKERYPKVSVTGNK